MHTVHESGGVVWIDLENPTRDEIQEIIQQFDIDPMVAEELLLPSTKPRAEFYSGFMYAILHFPALRHSHSSVEQEIDFIVGRDFIVTAHYDTIDSIHKFSKVFDANALLGSLETGNHAGYLFYYIMKKLYKSVEHETEHVRHHLKTIEEHLFEGNEVKVVAEISHSAQDLLSLRQTIEPHRDALHTMESQGAKLFGNEFVPFLRSLSNEYYRVHNQITRSTESIRELRETNNSLLSTKQNETVKVFTILAFVTFPLSLIATVFGMDTVNNPIVGQPNDFWIIIGFMGCATLLMFWYFKYKKWL